MESIYIVVSIIYGEIVINKSMKKIFILIMLCQIVNGSHLLDTIIFDNSTIISYKKYFNELERIIPNVRGQCNNLIDNSEQPKHVVAYFLNTKKEYVDIYNKLYKENPSTGDGGRCVIKKDSVIIFGYREIGFGSITHELVHAIIVPSWPNIPGWLNEALAQAFGAPSQTIGAITASKDLLKKGEYYTLAELFKHNEKDYLQHINRRKIIELDNMRIAGGIWLIGHSFVYYLKEKGYLSDFFKTYRNKNNVFVAIQEIGYTDILILENEFFEWLRDLSL